MPMETMEKQPAGAVAQTERTWSGRTYRPNVDILERDDELMVLADMPGVHRDDVDINFENSMLTIHGRVRPRQEKPPFLLREYGVGDFFRTFQVGEMIDVEHINAEYHDGVLTLHLPKVESARPRKIQVHAN